MRLIAAIALLCLGVGAADAQDAIEGEAVFRMCMACHSVGEDAANKVGPVLNAVVGRPAATYPGYAYSQTLINAGKKGLVWTENTLNAWLGSPRDFLPGTRMSFAGIRDSKRRADVIAYLTTLSPGYVPQTK